MIVRGRGRCLLLLLALYVASAAAPAHALVTVASKTFTESHVLAEMAAQLLESRGVAVRRRLGLGGTLIAYEALRAGEIDLYPEYTGTLSEAVLQAPGLPVAKLRQRLRTMGLRLLPSLGFNNTYAIAVAESRARALNLQRVSDLARHPALRFGFSHEFLNRGDGWPGLRLAYNLPQTAAGLEHALAYRAIANDQLDATDAYSTDGELAAFKLRLLEDDRAYFPRYEAALLVRDDLPAAVREVLLELSGMLSEQQIRQLNYRVSEGGESPAAVAADFLTVSGLRGSGVTAPAETLTRRILRHTGQHIRLTLTALVLACAVAIPASLLLVRHARLARSLLYASSLVQTIPALALLALLIPLLGLGTLPAIVALFLYSLLPIVRNTLSGIFAVDPLLIQVADGLGLSSRERLLRVELPLAAPAVLAGVKTAAVINVGTATLAAFVGAGGLGEPIITGLSLNDQQLILAGALPAALLAIAVELFFELLERVLVPAHLRAPGAGS